MKLTEADNMALRLNSVVVSLYFLAPEPLAFHSNSSSVILTRLSGPRSRPITSQKTWYRRESNLGPLDL
jgi:hypothetical protein